MAIHVNTDNFVRAETDRMFADLQRDAGGVNRFLHSREPAAIDKQTVIRMNRDTLYSIAIVDVSQGASLTIPDHGDRYVSAMIVNEDHYVNAILHEPGEYPLTMQEHGTPYVAVAVRTLVDPTDPADLAAVAAIQDGYLLEAASARTFEMPDYDEASFTATREGVLALAGGLSNYDRAFGRADEVDPIRHLLGTAAGWGGLPSEEATYLGGSTAGDADSYELVVRDVPVDGFWSVSVYNAQGFFELNDRDAYTVNSITAATEPDGSVVVRFGAGDAPNTIPIPDGWSYVVRLYRPRAEILDGSWTFPVATPVAAG